MWTAFFGPGIRFGYPAKESRLLLGIAIGLQFCANFFSTIVGPISLEVGQIVDGAGTCHHLEDIVLQGLEQGSVVLGVGRGSRHELEGILHKDALIRIHGDGFKGSPLCVGLADTGRPLNLEVCRIGAVVVPIRIAALVRKDGVNGRNLTVFIIGEVSTFNTDIDE